MNKIKINGEDWVKLKDVCDVIRIVRKDADEHDAGVLNRVVRMMFWDELKAAKSDEEKETVMEMPGDFIVFRRLDTGKKVEYFSHWDKGIGIATKEGSEAMEFEYESMAEYVAGKLGEGWEVLDINAESARARSRLLNAIFGEDEA